MRYVKTSDMEIGSKIAKPIYNKDGVLLYNAGVKIDSHMLTIFNELNLYGTYVLDSAEPVPPITPEELDFERFQCVQTYVVDEILLSVINDEEPKKLNELVDLLYHRFGFCTKKMTFNQCLRGENDFISKHTLNVAILTALLAGKMQLDNKEKKYLIEAAIFHDLGKFLVPPEILQKQGTLTDGEMAVMYRCLLDGFHILSTNYEYPAGVRRYIIQLSRDLSNRLPSYPNYDQVLLPGTRIIQVADIYDTLTAIRSYKSPMSPFSAIKIMRSESQRYDSSVVDALEQCIHILPAGSYVELSNGEQGIIVRENPTVLSRPVVLGLKSNTLYDLGMKATFSQIQIVDTVFTPDNRQQVQSDVSKLVDSLRP